MEIIDSLFEAVYYGTDLEFKYNGFYYFINSGVEKNNGKEIHSIDVYKSDYSFYGGVVKGESHEIFNSKNEDLNINTKMLFEKKIFDGKTLYEIVKDITEINY